MPGGDAFEYTGTGLEKLLGFLIALVILAFYLGILQVVLTFVGFNLLGALVGDASSPTDAALQLSGIYLTFLALAPLALFAQYSARRYVLSRTRWRGLRFAMDKETWGYVWRVLVFYGLALVTLGFLCPWRISSLKSIWRIACGMALRRWSKVAIGVCSRSRCCTFRWENAGLAARRCQRQFFPSAVNKL